MSVLAAICRVNLQKKPENKIRLRVCTKKEELSSKEALACVDPSIQLSFLLSKAVKEIELILQENIEEDRWGMIGKTSFSLYIVNEIREGQKAVKLIQLNKAVEGNVQSDLDRIAGSLALEISRSSKRKILSQIEEIEFVKKKQQVAPSQVEQFKESKQNQQIYEEISISLSEKQPNLALASAKNEIKKDNSLYEVDHEGLVTLKPLKPQVQLHQILQQLDYSAIPEQKLHLSHNEIKEHSLIDPAVLKESAVIKHIRMKEPTKKPPIFTLPPQKDHIDLDINSNMFQAYHMCCGDQIDRSHQRQQSY